MARFILLLAPALAAPECLKSGLGKEPFQPLPSFYLANWAACAENCAKSLGRRHADPLVQTVAHILIMIRRSYHKEYINVSPSHHVV